MSYLDILTDAANLAEAHAAQVAWPSSSILDLTLDDHELRLAATEDGIEAYEHGDLQGIFHTQAEVSFIVTAWVREAH